MKKRQKFQLRTTTLGNYGEARSRSENDVSLSRDYEHMQNHGKTKQMTEPKMSISGSFEETVIFPTGNSTAVTRENAHSNENINPRGVSFSTALLQGQRKNPHGISQLLHKALKFMEETQTKHHASGNSF